MHSRWHLLSDPLEKALKVCNAIGSYLHHDDRARPASLETPQIAPRLVQGIQIQHDLLRGAVRTPRISSLAGVEQEVPARAFRNGPRDEQTGAGVVGRAVEPRNGTSDARPHRETERDCIVSQRLGVRTPEVTGDTLPAIGDCNRDSMRFFFVYRCAHTKAPSGEPECSSTFRISSLTQY